MVPGHDETMGVFAIPRWWIHRSLPGIMCRGGSRSPDRTAESAGLRRKAHPAPRKDHAVAVDASIPTLGTTSKEWIPCKMPFIFPLLLELCLAHHESYLAPSSISSRATSTRPLRVAQNLHGFWMGMGMLLQGTAVRLLPAICNRRQDMETLRLYPAP